MKLMNVTRRMMCSLLLAAFVLNVNAVERLLIVGDAVWGGWHIPNSFIMINTDEQPDVWKATVSLNANAGFKLLTQTCWGGLEFRAGNEDVMLTAGVPSALVSSNDDNGKDCKFKVSEKANYDVVCDLVNNKITVTKAAYQDTDVKHPALWMVGSATPGNWSVDDGTILVQDATNPNVFATTVDFVEGEMKIAVNKYGGFDQTFYLRDVTDDTKMVFGGDDNKWYITKAGKYDVKVDVSAMTISIKEHADVETGISAVNNEQSVVVSHYTLAGAKTTGTAKGLTIVVNSNGKAKKVLKY